MARRRVLSFVSSLAALAAALPVLAQEAPVREVVLFEAGLAEIVREGEGGRVVLSVPLRDVDDVLKSLLLRGEGITGARMSLDGESPVEDAFAALPFPPEAATDLGALVRAVPGLRVRVTEPGHAGGREGTLMGAAEECSEARGCQTVLTVLGDGGGVRRHILREGTELVILDEAVREALARGLGALRAAAGGQLREVAVAVEGEGPFALSYVIAAPAWKTAYRAVLRGEGAVDLQAWAVVENATGEDWEDVALTLSSGSPRTIDAELHRRDWRGREPMEWAAPAMAAAAAPMAARGADAMEAAPMPAPVAAAAEAAEGVIDSRFALGVPVDLPAGAMLSLPFLSEPLGARHLALWRGEARTRTGNPERVLEVRNTLSVRLPAGVMTVSDEAGGYVGDAAFPLLAPGEERAVAYGTDRQLRVEETASETVRQVSVRAAAGVLRIGQERVREVAYRILAPAGGDGEVIVEHPLAQGWEAEVLDGPGGAVRQDEGGLRWLRVAVPVAEGEGVLRVRDRYPFEQTVEIATLGEEALLGWQGRAADEETRRYLEEAAALARALREAETGLARAQAERDDSLARHERARAMLAVVPEGSELQARFLEDLLAAEQAVTEAEAAVRAGRERVEAAREALEAHLSG
ncbi:DUF4139 domain-containing protein [Rubellimicrobium sp. CFH 75288]|uniref:DUF4139 domain-containing protein n=1 Tax=Rubellimicrobium sp. CFH 75288 TaxID=2697034 RepID=UPI001412C527|nr:DUF4139 domain-containing protein [Rubellimicrobium sp. CFH 75288]NAZ35491.1 DUF4139 domain-containing protein [Rubellimicrobium sp. CFH 75288]